MCIGLYYCVLLSITVYWLVLLCLVCIIMYCSVFLFIALSSCVLLFIASGKLAVYGSVAVGVVQIIWELLSGPIKRT